MLGININLLRRTPRYIFRKLCTLAQIKFRERKFKGRLPYLFFNNHSDSLIIVFSGFGGEKRKYNYVKGLGNKNIHADRLYILDPFGYLGSYNLFENGENYPELLTKELIKSILDKKHYVKVYTAGSSKGGTCAIYFGLEYNVDAIYSGACQYNLGTYLGRPEFSRILKGMIGGGSETDWIEKLDAVMPSVLRKHNNSNSVVHVLYSKKELTYERQIIDLMADLKKNKIPFVDVERDFERHEDVGKPFLDYLQEQFGNRFLQE